MNTKMKDVLISDVLTGLLVAVTLAAVIPGDAFAQGGLASVTTQAQTNIAKPFLTFVSYICYCLGTVMTVAGISSAKKHADNPSGEPLNKSLGRLGAGAAFLAAPTLVGMVLATGSDTLNGGTASFTAIPGF